MKTFLRNIAKTEKEQTPENLKITEMEIQMKSYIEDRDKDNYKRISTMVEEIKKSKKYLLKLLITIKLYELILSFINNETYFLKNSNKRYSMTYFENIDLKRTILGSKLPL